MKWSKDLFEYVGAKDADEVKKEYFKFITVVQNEHKDAFLTFDENKVCVDSFFFNFMHGNTKFRKCWDVFKLVFILSVSQTSCCRKRVSVNKELLVGNFQQLSLVSQRIVNDYVTDFGKSIIKVPLTSALLKSSQLAHSRYSTVLEMNKNEAHAQEKNRKRKLKTEEFAELKEKKRALEAVRNWHWEIQFCCWKGEQPDFIDISEFLQSYSQWKEGNIVFSRICFDKIKQRAKTNLTLMFDSLIWWYVVLVDLFCCFFFFFICDSLKVHNFWQVKSAQSK